MPVRDRGVRVRMRAALCAGADDVPMVRERAVAVALGPMRLKRGIGAGGNPPPRHSTSKNRITTSSGRRTPLPMKTRSMIQRSNADAVSKVGTQRK